MNSSWIELHGFFLSNKIIFVELKPLQTFEMELFVTIVDSWTLLTSVTSFLDPPLLNYDFQRTEEDCSNVAALVVYVVGGRPPAMINSNPKCNQDFNETI